MNLCGVLSPWCVESCRYIQMCYWTTQWIYFQILETYRLTSTVTSQICTTVINKWGPSFNSFPREFTVICFLDDCHPECSEIETQSNYLYFPNGKEHWILFKIISWSFVFLFLENCLLNSQTQIFIGCLNFSLVFIVICIFWVLMPCLVFSLKNCIHSLLAVFTQVDGSNTGQWMPQQQDRNPFQQEWGQAGTKQIFLNPCFFF